MTLLRIASFNVENLFDRARVLGVADDAQRATVLAQHAEVNELLGRAKYDAADKARIVEVLTALGVAASDDSGPFAALRQSRGRLLKRSLGKAPEVVAGGRADWVGSVELKREAIDEVATRHTAMVMRDVNPDVMGVIEAESRTTLRDFSDILLRAVKGEPFDHVMLIDGNDDRGIDVGIMTRNGHTVTSVRSHVEDEDVKGEIFSRDCPEYTVETRSGVELVVLVNHLKSKGFGSQKANDAKRKRQAKRVAAIYRGLRKAGRDNVVVLGDFNDTPDSAALAPLLATDLKEVAEHPKFTDDGRPGTFRNGTKSNKIDYILLSPALFGSVTGGHYFRKGVWGGKNGDLWEIYPTMTRGTEAASDHAAVVAELDL